MNPAECEGKCSELIKDNYNHWRHLPLKVRFCADVDRYNDGTRKLLGFSDGSVGDNGTTGSFAWLAGEALRGCSARRNPNRATTALHCSPNN